MYAYILYACLVLMEATRGSGIAQNWSYRSLEAPYRFWVFCKSSKCS